MNCRRGKKNRITSGNPPGEGRIDPGTPPPDQRIYFSFRYLHPHPPVDQTFPNENYISELMRALKEASNWHRGELVGNRNKALRAHGIDWNDSNIPHDRFEEGLPEQFKGYDGYQLSVGRDLGRVIGLLAGNVFYVRWLDPGHETTGRQRR